MDGWISGWMDGLRDEWSVDVQLGGWMDKYRDSHPITTSHSEAFLPPSSG